MISRRHLFRSGLAATAGVFAYTFKIEPHWLEIVERPLPIAGLPQELVGARLVQLSDLHLGLEVDDGYVLETFERVSRLAPEIVVYTGDFVSYHAGSLEQVERIMAHGARGSLATVGVLGNHDYGHAWSQSEVARAITTRLEAAGVTILRNGILWTKGLALIGLDDLWGTHFRPRPTLRALPPGQPAVVLSHNPDTVDLPIWKGFQGWILSGHTHGGQCKPPFLPPPLTPVRNPRYTAGEFELEGGRRLYINRGVGHLLAVRFNVRPEVTVFELVRPAGPPAAPG